MREVHGAEDTETVGVAVTNRGTVVAVTDIVAAAASRQIAAAVAVVCAKGPKH
jgi:hypothetical protein